VFSNFGKAAPSLTVASKQLAPFATATNISLRSLGNAAVQAGPLLVQADPTIQNLANLAKAGASPLTNLGKLLKSVRTTKGFEKLVSFLYNNVGWTNGYDQFGHLIRQNLLASNCIDYATVPAQECQANWKHATASASASGAGTPNLGQLRRLLALKARSNLKQGRGAGRTKPLNQPTRTGPRPAGTGKGAKIPGAGGSARDVLKYLLGQ